MMEEINLSGAECDEFDFYDEKPSGERWAPVGASELDDDGAYEGQEDSCYNSEASRLRDLEEQLDVVNSSLIALTTHFAQVQFRLRQIVDAPVKDKDVLLKELEEFAFRGIPEVQKNFPFKQDGDGSSSEKSAFQSRVSEQQSQQRELISQLKAQLADLEQYAYETGEAGLPQSVILERQKMLIGDYVEICYVRNSDSQNTVVLNSCFTDQLKGKLNLNMDDIEKLSPDDLKMQVDQAIGQLINPLKMKEQLVTQLKTQISDLERFVEFLQGEAVPDNTVAMRSGCTCNRKTHTESCRKNMRSQGYRHNQKFKDDNEEKIRAKTISIMKRMAILLQIFAASQFGCGPDAFHKNSLKKTTKGNHWGDLRARLEVAVAHVSELMAEASESPGTCDSEDYASDSEDAPTVLCNAKVTTAVRKKLAIAIRDLMEHGLTHGNQTMSLVPFIGCFPVRGPSTSRIHCMHAWELILRYYELKNGDTYNSTPARKLSQSFNLELVGGVAVSNKQQLLSLIGNIMVTHTRYKRSYDSHFKAFVCAGLNSKKLVAWLRLIFRCPAIVETYYEPWSYVNRTGFEDSLRTLEKLNQFDFELPVDLAVRQLQNIKDAF